MPRIIGLTKAYHELPFCRSTTGKTTELVCFQNRGQSVATLVILDTVLQYGIPPGGRFYCVLCEEAFVIAFKSVFCDTYEIRVNNGKHQCVINKDGENLYSSEYLPVYEGLITLNQDGSISVLDYRWRVSPYGNPIVYARNAMAIDSKGYLIIQEKYRFPEMNRHQYIMAGTEGRECVTSDRKIMFRTGLSSPSDELIVDMASNSYYDMVLTQYGSVYYCEGTDEWHWLGANATVIAAGGHNILAIAKKTGVVRVFTSGQGGEFRQEIELYFVGKRIVDMDINRMMLAVHFLDGQYEVINWHLKTPVDFI